MTLLAILSLSLLLLPNALALPNVTAIPAGPGDCSAYPNFYGTNGRTSDAFIFLPSQADNPSVNNLKTSILNNTLVVLNDPSADPTIFCCIAPNIFDGWAERTLLLEGDRRMRYTSQGVTPELYVHEIEGVKQEGVFLGSEGVTRWVFGEIEGGWGVRLDGDGVVNEGEFKGFLRAELP
ncbi:hypothetical protein GLAREA_11709 [Glarea lozoyensis ATCC 20868]|nr:uncharacterized protein GLAREA_11709 [Glarea lozoyensis ATCC 20868]EPE25128.1 hypothetical protein GLAREA_11709 [Glarea lozoyensis ATCC 20868]